MSACLAKCEGGWVICISQPLGIHPGFLSCLLPITQAFRSVGIASLSFWTPQPSKFSLEPCRPQPWSGCNLWAEFLHCPIVFLPGSPRSLKAGGKTAISSISVRKPFPAEYFELSCFFAAECLQSKLI